jgi:hypothetical protein
MFTYELARRLKAKGASTIALAAHPGGSNTELTRYIPSAIRPPIELVWGLTTQSADMGALPTLRAATDPAATGGQYYGPGGLGEFRGNPKVVDSSKKSKDQAIQGRLWEISGKLTGVTYPV